MTGSGPRTRSAPRCAPLLAALAGCASSCVSPVALDVPIEPSTQAVIFIAAGEKGEVLSIEAVARGASARFVASDAGVVKLTALLYDRSLEDLSLPSGSLPFEASADMGRPLPEARSLFEHGLSPAGDLDAGAAQLIEAGHHGPGTAAAAEHQGAALAPVGLRLPQRPVEALHIGVGAEPATPVAGHQHVHRPQPFGQGAELAAEPGHALFVGNGDVEAAAADGLQALHNGAQLLRRGGQGQKHPVERHGLEGGVVHRRREGVVHRITEKAHQRSAGADRPRAAHEPGVRADPPACLVICSGTTPRLGAPALVKMQRFKTTFEKEVGSHGQGCWH